MTSRIPRKSKPSSVIRIGYVILAGLTLAVLTVSVADELPVSGVEIPELAIFDQIMLDFMCEHNIEAGLLAVMKDGCIVYQRGFGWQDAAHHTELSEHAMMRLASVTKPITARAIHKLIAAGEIGLLEHRGG